jgi:hypothetical protein
VRGREWVSLIFVPHFSQLGWIYFAAGTKILGRSLSRSSANAEQVSPMRIIEAALSHSSSLQSRGTETLADGNVPSD